MNQKKDLISVITPCLNLYSDGRIEYFKMMMESVHSQTYKYTQHIVVDGGSTDGTYDLLKSYKEKGWITNLIVLEGSSIYSAINKGFEFAQGSYINIMNTDDYFLNRSFFEKGIKQLKESKVDFIHGDRVIKSRNGGIDFIKRGKEINAFFRMPFRHQTMIVRKEVYDDVGLFDENYMIASDYKWVLSMLLKGKRGEYIPEVFVQSLDGGMSSNRKKCIEEVSSILFDSYGKKYGLTLEDCRIIYIRNMSIKLLMKILFQVRHWKIKKSLIYSYFQKQQR